MTPTDLERAIRQMQEGLDKAFPKAQGPEVEVLKARVLALQEDLKRAPLPQTGQFAALGMVRVYKQVKEILSLYRALVIPLLADLEKQRLETLAHMAKAMGAP